MMKNFAEAQDCVCARCSLSTVQVAAGLLAFMRHGRTGLNAQHYAVGALDDPMDDVGRRQIRVATKHMSDQQMRFDIVLHSPLQRARESAEIAQAILGISERREEIWLTERDVGDLQGKPENPETAKNLFDAVWSDAIPGAEPLAPFEARVTLGLEQIRQELSERYVLCVTHGFWMKTAVKLIRGLSVQETMQYQPPGNGELLSLRVGPPCKNCGGVYYTN